MVGGVNGSVPSSEMYAGGPSIGISRSPGTKDAGAVSSVEVGGAVMLGKDGSEVRGTVWERAVRRFSGKDAIRKTEVSMRTL